MHFAAFAATILFFFGHLLSLVRRMVFLDRKHDFRLLEELDPLYLRTEWEWRREHQLLESVAGLLRALGWVTLCIPILQAAWILSKGGRYKIGLHAIIGSLAFAGSVTELVSRLMMVGTQNTSYWMASSFNLDDWISVNSADGLGWRVLEMSNLTVRGMILWIDAFEWLALFGIMTSIFISVSSSGGSTLLGQRWSAFGLLIGLLCLFDFFANILRFEDFQAFMHYVFYVSALNTLIFLPIWMLILGNQLMSATAQFEATEAFSEQSAAAKSSNVPYNGPNESEGQFSNEVGLT